MTAGRNPARRLPPWFKIPLSTGARYVAIRALVRDHGLRTVCQSAACPNRNECWNAGTATFLLLGNACTRGCRFCNIPAGDPPSADPDEPRRVADAVASLGLSYAVVTSVTRDDLPDGGAGAFAETIRSIRRRMPGCRVEVLIPDFQGSPAALGTVLAASPDVLNHNMETVPSLYPQVRPRADYERSLQVLARAAELGFLTKSGMMLGLGEDHAEVRRVMVDLRDAGCELLTLGQYLQPRKDLLPVARYYHPEEFQMLEREGRELGFRVVQAGPRVRSSYHAAATGVHGR
jgi:lipoic acid synthetase